MKKLFSLLVCAAILLTLLPTVVLAEEYPSLTYNEPVNVSLAEGESKWFRFTPNTDGTYMFYSYDYVDADPYAILYDSTMTELAENDDYSDRNFRISYALTAGETYYLEAFEYSRDNAGSYMLCVGEIMPTTISVSPESDDVYEGVTYALSAVIYPDDAKKTVTWTSSDETVATVDANGVVTFLSSGTVVITAETVNGLTDTCEFNVVAVDGTLSLDTAQTVTFTGTERVYVFEFTPAQDGYYRFASFDIVTESVDGHKIDPKVSIDDARCGQIGSDDDGGEEGNFRADVELKGGEPYFVRARTYYSDSIGSYTFNVVKMPEAVSMVINEGDLTMEQGDDKELSVSYAPDGCWVEDFTLSSSDESVVAIEGDHDIIAVGGGEAVITATSDAGLTASVTVTVVGVPEIELNKTYTASGSEENGEDRVRFAFKPTVSGRYTITSDNAVGEGALAYVMLRDVYSDFRSCDTDSSSFKLTYELEADKWYYYDVYLKGEDIEASVDFVMTKEDDSTIPVAEQDTDYDITISADGNGAYYAFTPAITGTYTIFSATEHEVVDPKVKLFSDEWEFVDSDDSSANDDYDNFLLEIFLEKGKTYYLKFKDYYSYGYGDYVVRIELEEVAMSEVELAIENVTDDTDVTIHFYEEGMPEPAYEALIMGNNYVDMEVLYGTYTIKVFADGYAMYTTTIEVDDDYEYVTVSMEEVTVVFGDVNFDGQVTAFDALMILQEANGKGVLTGDALVAADVNGDGPITAFDALGALQIANSAT